jgi:ABC-2 type transport system permease protein
MKISNALLVFRKDWREIKRNWQVLLPIIILPLIFAVVLPLVFSTPSGDSGSTDLGPLIKMLPQAAQQQISGLNPDHVIFYVMVLYFFAPFFLIIPIMVSSVIASDSFAGEKERKTIEALLATPLSDSELLFGKILVSFIPSMLVTWVSFAAYSAIVDFVSLSLFGMAILPTSTWLVLVFLLAPAVALAGIGISVIISARVRGFREAQQISGILVVPIIALLFAQISGVVVLGPIITVGMAGIVGLLDIILIYIGVKKFRREEILSRM